jgi:hypothetical protein
LKSGQRDVFREFSKKVDECTENFTEKWSKKVGFCPFLESKSGQKKSDPFSENGTFLAFFAPFWAICANLLG